MYTSVAAAVGADVLAAALAVIVSRMKPKSEMPEEIATDLDDDSDILLPHARAKFTWSETNEKRFRALCRGYPITMIELDADVVPLAVSDLATALKTSAAFTVYETVKGMYERGTDDPMIE